MKSLKYFLKLGQNQKYVGLLLPDRVYKKRACQKIVLMLIPDSQMYYHSYAYPGKFLVLSSASFFSYLCCLTSLTHCPLRGLHFLHYIRLSNKSMEG